MLFRVPTATTKNHQTYKQQIIYKCYTYIKLKHTKGIQGNEEANKLAKQGAKKETLPIEEIYHNTHTSPHWLHKAKPCQYGKPFKDLIRNYQKYLQQKELANQKIQAIKYPP